MRSRQPGTAGVPVRRAARHGQDLARPDPRQGSELRAWSHTGALQRLPLVRLDLGRHLTRRDRDGRRFQRGIDDIREIRDRVILQPVEGRSKVYILDEAHQLTDAAWNALLKLIEEPPPHLLFVFCTTELAKVLPTVRSRCQTFVFQRPRLPDLIKLLRRVADGESMDAPDAALGLVARSARGSFRDAVSTLDQLAAATGGVIPCRTCSQLLGAVEEEVLFRLCDLVVDGDTAGALVFLEELSERGQDLGRLVIDLLEHLRALMLVQHTGDVPETLPVTGETRDRLRDQANQLGASTVVPPDRPADTRRRRHAPGRRPAAAARARPRQGDAARRPTSPARGSPTGCSASKRGTRPRRPRSGRPALPRRSHRSRRGDMTRPCRRRRRPTSTSRSCRRPGGEAMLPAVEERSIPTAACSARRTLRGSRATR